MRYVPLISVQRTKVDAYVRTRLSWHMHTRGGNDINGPQMRMCAHCVIGNDIDDHNSMSD